MIDLGIGMTVFAPAEPSVLRISSAQATPASRGVPAWPGSTLGSRWIPVRSTAISATGLPGERAALVLLVGRALPAEEVERPAAVGGDEGPRPEVGVVVPAVVLPGDDRRLDRVSLVRGPVRIAAVVGQHAHPAAGHLAADDGGVQDEPVVVHLD